MVQRPWQEVGWLQDVCDRGVEQELFIGRLQISAFVVGRKDKASCGPFAFLMVFVFPGERLGDNWRLWRLCRDSNQWSSEGGKRPFRQPRGWVFCASHVQIESLTKCVAASSASSGSSASTSRRKQRPRARPGTPAGGKHLSQ